ncbi:MAG: family acetyltransferase [Paucimonas sp.]|jgi:ribosomal protein S18 acetylase RimI-like enzyme|nr:family acetyltransferase [Paucimonas sp.]
MSFEIHTADYSNAIHAKALIALLDSYSRDPMGGGRPLNDYVVCHLAERLSTFPTAFGVIAFHDGEPAGLVNCFEGFSTFACKPLANLHDVVVERKFRGKGLAFEMLQKVETLARERGCCKLTLEVLGSNEVAQRLYRKGGFGPYNLGEGNGNAELWQKRLA